MKNLILFMLLLVAVTFGACDKQENSSITGTAKDSNGVAIQGVEVEASSGEIATTASDGTYTITADKQGDLTFTKSGYRTQKVAINDKTTVDANLPTDEFNSSYFATANNSIENPNFVTNSIQPTTNLTATSPTGAWYTTAAYKGAVDANGTPWYAGWSFYSNLVAGNMNSNTMTLPTTVQTVTTATIDSMPSDTIKWNRNTLYKLSGFVFIGDNKVLEIEAGTIIQGMAGTGANASALIVARGGKIHAVGTVNNPIVFTFDGDGGGTVATTRGQWGGLIILGKASLNSTGNESSIEGIPTTEIRGLYGGNDDMDNSGILKYISIRHGGSNIGSNNEINGLTLGGVGAGTTMDYIEVIGNKDDGIEWFGGTVNAKHLISAFCADDALDYDEGYRGKNQFVIVHQDPTNAESADRGGEHDGGTDPETATPYATPVFYNATFIGSPTERILTFRDNAGGEYHNSIFTGFGRGIDIEDLVGQTQDSYAQYEAGNLKLENNVFYNIGTATTGSELFTTSN